MKSQKALCKVIVALFFLQFYYSWPACGTEQHIADISIDVREGQAPVVGYDLAQEIIEADPVRILLEMQGESVAIHRSESLAKNGYFVWRGRDGSNQNATIVVSSNRVGGYIGTNIKLSTSDDGTVAVERQDDVERLLGGCANDSELIFRSKASLSCNAGDGWIVPTTEQTIDALLVYTPQARVSAGSSAAIELVARTALEHANTIYRDSLTNIQFREAGVVEVQYVEVDDSQTQLNWLADSNNQTIRQLRDYYSADIVTMFVSDMEEPSGGNPICGRAKTLYRSDLPFGSPEKKAFQVTSLNREGADCLSAEQATWAHENGHILGAQHNFEHAGTPRDAATFCFSYGFYNDAIIDKNSISTIMSSELACGKYFPCYPVPFLSNPDVTSSGGIKLGDKDSSDNARAVSLASSLVSRYRPSNDHFRNAADISGFEGTSTGAIYGSSREPLEPVHFSRQGGTIWWRWQTVETAEMLFSTWGSDADVGIAVYEGSSLNSLSLVTSADIEGGFETVRFISSAPEYYVAVERYPETSEDIDVQLTWRERSRESDLIVTASSDLGAVAIGGTVTLTLTLLNQGDGFVQDAAARAFLPVNVDFVAAQSSPSCTESGGIVTCFAGLLTPLAGVDFSIQVTVQDSPKTDVRVVTPDTYRVLQPGEILDLSWVTFNSAKSDPMTLSMKRDAVPQAVVDPDTTDSWYRFSESFTNVGNSGVTAEIPTGACGANDWRLYVKHNDSDAFDGTDIVFDLNAAPCQDFPSVATLPTRVMTPRKVTSDQMIISFDATDQLLSGFNEATRGDLAVTITDGGGDGTVSPVSIDIKPGSNDNPINYNSNGKIPVAILSSATFDAPSEVDQPALRFGRTGTEESLHYRGNGEPNCSGDEDHNGDGRLDLLCHFHTPIAGFQEGDTAGILTGATLGGEAFEGRDQVRIVGPGIFSSGFDSGSLGDWTVVQQ